MDCAYFWIFFISKSGVDLVKLTVTESFGNKLSQPDAHPSINTSSKPCSEAKSIYFTLRSLVAPCLKPSSQVHFPIIIPHQIPIYFAGLTQDASSMTLGLLQFKVRLELIKSFAFSTIIIVLQGVSKGSFVLTLSPFAHGAKSHIKVFLSLNNCILE